MSLLAAPFRAAYVTSVFCGDETDLVLVIKVGKALFVDRVASYQHPNKGEPLRDPFRSLLLRGEPARPQIWLTLARDHCQRTLWIGVGSSGKPSVQESQDCGQRDPIPAPPGLQFP